MKDFLPCIILLAKPQLSCQVGLGDCDYVGADQLHGYAAVLLSLSGSFQKIYIGASL